MSALNNNTWRFKNQVARELTHRPAAFWSKTIALLSESIGSRGQPQPIGGQASCLARMTARGFAVFSWLKSVRPRRLTKVWLGKDADMARRTWVFPIASSVDSGGVSMDTSGLRRASSSGCTFNQWLFIRTVCHLGMRQRQAVGRVFWNSTWGKINEPLFCD